MSKRWERLLPAGVALGAAAVMIGAIAYFVRPVLRPDPPSSPSDSQVAKVEARPGLGQWGREEVIRMAGRIAQAEVSEKTIMPPALEVERERTSRATEAADTGVRVITGFECSVPLGIRKLSDSHFSLRIKTEGYRNWFMFRVEGIPTGGKTVRIDLDAVNLGKWRTLNPVYSSCESLSDLSAFEAAPSKGEPVAAHNGPLLPDTRGQQWHYIPDTWCEGASRLSFVHHFERDAYVAMRCPYTPKLNEQLLAEISRSRYAEVLTLGSSATGYPLQLVKIGGGESAEKRNPCIVIYAREHPSEHDSSWAAWGAIRAALSDGVEGAKLRESLTVLVVPLLDPDGAAQSRYINILGTFVAFSETPESIAYASFFRQWCLAGKRLDLVLNVHNVESHEAPHVSSPLIEQDAGRQKYSRSVHNYVRTRILEADWAISETPGGGESFPTRLSGWLSRCFGVMPVAYEVNSQDANRHLTLRELEDIGWRLLLASGEFMASEDGQEMRQEIDEKRARWRERLVRFPTEEGNDGAIRSEYKCRFKSVAAGFESIDP